MRGKWALLAAGTGLLGYLGKKIYDKNQSTAPQSQTAERERSDEGKSDSQPEAAVEAAFEASAKNKFNERKIGECPNCKRVIRYSDIESWKGYGGNCTMPISQKYGHCSDCGQPITVRGIGGIVPCMQWWIVEDRNQGASNDL